MKRMKPKCSDCGETFSAKRARAGYKLCLWCGEEAALRARKLWCVAGINKSNPMLITDPQTLKQLNPKRCEA
jgi:ribosomal protein L37AE/L43A